MPKRATPIREQRLKRGWTQADLAEAIAAEGVQVSQSHISKIESGKCMPYPPLRLALSRILGLDIDLQKVEVDA
ncbi:helix-turn-helix transcriptional regulator [Nonomuraea typhae]|uniref:helix-turn-helix transcriptional regulator n=1 Tax=Nonomuraea typhae TaxID=2603600 RepID=UPI0012FC31B8|nr:helix-turn-helix transcriptional regulator [Nonomuraea typhae]